MIRWRSSVKQISYCNECCAGIFLRLCLVYKFPIKTTGDAHLSTLVMIASYLIASLSNMLPKLFVIPSQLLLVFPRIRFCFSFSSFHTSMTYFHTSMTYFHTSMTYFHTSMTYFHTSMIYLLTQPTMPTLTLL